MEVRQVRAVLGSKDIQVIVGMQIIEATQMTETSGLGMCKDIEAMQNLQVTQCCDLHCINKGFLSRRDGR